MNLEEAFASNKCILVWRWEDAPEEFRKLSEHGGDEDWVALVPLNYDELYDPPMWMEHTSFGACDVSKHSTAYGNVYIGAHS